MGFRVYEQISFCWVLCVALMGDLCRESKVFHDENIDLIGNVLMRAVPIVSEFAENNARYRNDVAETHEKIIETMSAFSGFRSKKWWNDTVFAKLMQLYEYWAKEDPEFPERFEMIRDSINALMGESAHHVHDGL